MCLYTIHGILKLLEFSRGCHRNPNLQDELWVVQFKHTYRSINI